MKCDVIAAGIVNAAKGVSSSLKSHCNEMQCHLTWQGSNPLKLQIPSFSMTDLTSLHGCKHTPIS